MKKKPRNKARLKLARAGVERMAASMRHIGIDPRVHTVRLGGQQPTRYETPKTR